MEIIWEVKFTDIIIATSFAISIITGVAAVTQLFYRKQKMVEKMNRQESQLASLSSISASQLSIIEEMQNQIKELKELAREAHRQSTLMIDSNNLTKDNLDIEINRFDIETKGKYQDIIEYVQVLLSVLKPALIKQIENLESLIIFLEALNIENYTLEIHTDIQTISFDTIEPKDLFKAFVNFQDGDRALKIKNFNLLSNSFNYLRKFQDSISSMLLRFSGKYISYQSSWAKGITGIQFLIQNYLASNVRNNIGPADDEFMKSCDLILSSTLKKIVAEEPDSKNPYILIDSTIEPLRILCNTNIHDPRANELLTPIMTCKTSFAEIQELKKSFVALIKSHLKQLKGVLKNVDEFLIKTDKLDNK